jgi:hypothetical protein
VHNGPTQQHPGYPVRLGNEADVGDQSLDELHDTPRYADKSNCYIIHYIVIFVNVHQR